MEESKQKKVMLVTDSTFSGVNSHSHRNDFLIILEVIFLYLFMIITFPFRAILRLILKDNFCFITMMTFNMIKNKKNLKSILEKKDNFDKIFGEIFYKFGYEKYDFKIQTLNGLTYSVFKKSEYSRKFFERKITEFKPECLILTIGLNDALYRESKANIMEGFKELCILSVENGVKEIVLVKPPYYWLSNLIEAKESNRYIKNIINAFEIGFAGALSVFNISSLNHDDLSWRLIYRADLDSFCEKIGDEYYYSAGERKLRIIFDEADFLNVLGMKTLNRCKSEGIEYLGIDCLHPSSAFTKEFEKEIDSISTEI